MGILISSQAACGKKCAQATWSGLGTTGVRQVELYVTTRSFGETRSHVEGPGLSIAYEFVTELDIASPVLRDVTSVLVFHRDAPQESKWRTRGAGVCIIADPKFKHVQTSSLIFDYEGIIECSGDPESN